MTYSLANLNEQQLKRWLYSVPISFLRDPIMRSPKSFSNIPKGFRPNKLMHQQLVPIYTNEITKNSDCVQAKTIEAFVSSNLDEIGISEILDSESSINEKLISITKTLIAAQYTVSSDLILSLANINVSDDNLELAGQLFELLSHQVIAAEERGKLEGSKAAEKDADTQIGIVHKQKERLEKELNTIQHQLSIAVENCSQVSAERDEARRQLHEAELSLSGLNSEKNSVVKRYSELQYEAQKKDVRITELNEQVLEIDKIKRELDEALETQNVLYQKIAQLQKKTFSSATIKEICADTVSDLQEQGLSNTEIITCAKTYFLSDVSTEDAWSTLDERSFELLGFVIEKFCNNQVVATDIDLLDEIENCLSIQYLISRSIKTAFFKALEQKSSGVSIEEAFRLERYSEDEEKSLTN